MLALERRIDADLACGRHAEVVTEAGELARAHPLRERPRWLYMLALYRGGRQAEALDSYRQARTLLVEELGIEPGQALQELERAILRHDPALDAGESGRPPTTPSASARAIVVAALGAAPLDDLVELATPLAREPQRELLLVRTVADVSELGTTTSLLRPLRSRLLDDGIAARTAAFTSFVPGADLARLGTEQDADLMLVDAPEQLLEDGRVVSLLAQAPCDVGIVVGSPARHGGVFVPFGGGEHDWAAVELGAWLARSTDVGLALAGALVGPAGRDSSRLLASASLAVQRALGVPAEPVLVEPEPSALVAAAAQAAVVCVGLPDRWQREGLGPTRTALAARAEGVTILVRRGVRPGRTRAAWGRDALHMDDRRLSPHLAQGGGVPRLHAGSVQEGDGVSALKRPPNRCSTPSTRRTGTASARPSARRLIRSSEVRTTACRFASRRTGPYGRSSSSVDSARLKSPCPSPSLPPVASSADATASTAAYEEKVGSWVATLAASSGIRAFERLPERSHRLVVGVERHEPSDHDPGRVDARRGEGALVVERRA